MEIKNHVLYDPDNTRITYSHTPNRSGLYVPKYLVMHYTAVTTMQSTVNWFQNPNAQASAHLLIGRDGAIHQFAPFNVVTWHAGRSSWRGLSGLNWHSIGIELVNGGRLVRKGAKWVCPVDGRPVPDDNVVMAVHKNENQVAGWHEYTEQQLEVSLHIASLLVNAYNLQDVLGHEDISPLRKSDPGPAFPMSSFRARAMGRRDETLDEYVTSTDLNIRSGPGAGYSVLSRPLPAGTRVLSLKQEGNWSFVEVLDVVHGIMDLEGWVARKYLV
ncbi:N-acetylmuramoyl-L-alanine amidase [Pontibacter diazotrophicus]|uniref:N-acetylmuramoyl-L-alanine amidase n=1 Tax=Pontibacter diazotrophicus TaxID=1400979 RepID=A0A3D8LH29_9BACT|nr:N-acetylmuramoyl-L-alanine amidase [Pontibacter diazotrophicus]RDV16759.1 N-acetylmuramoyl-L-alanine amidase [Pontibacter diazotrophicus]